AVIAIENTRLLNELNESLEQQTATSQVLQVISASPGDLAPVFDSMLANAMHICEAKFGNLFLYEGNKVRLAAISNAPPGYTELFESGALDPAPHTALGQIFATKQVVHIPDVTDEQAYAEREPLRVATVELLKAKTLVGVPMLKDDELIGAIVIYRQEVRPFTDKQIELLQSFAAQAVIAIENARLLNELRQRTDDLSESLAQQTATSDILGVISNSPTDSQPAFDAIVRSGLKLFPDAVVAISLPEGDQVTLAAIAGADPGDLDALRERYPMPLSPEFITGTAILDGREMDFADAREAPEPLTPGRQNFLASGYRAITVMPMMRGETAIGAITVIHRRSRQLSDKQRGLLRTFASQAVIAIENTRLFSELRQRTDDLSESLEQQTATSEILGVISRSPTNLQPVFDAIVENAAHLCDASNASVYRVEGDEMYHVANYGGVGIVGAGESRPVTEGSLSGRAVIGREIIHFHDALAVADELPDSRAAIERENIRTSLAIPLMRGDALLGVFVARRNVVRDFTDKQIALLKTFADQAVIAIENTRLFNELRERTDDLTQALEQQTATAEVLSVMSRSKFDLMPVLQSVVDTAARLCRADQAVIFRLEDGLYRFAAGYSLHPEYLEIERANPISPGSGTAVGRTAMSRAVVCIEDAMSDAGYQVKEQAAVGNLRTIIGVPLLRDGEPIGVIALARSRVEPFSEREIELVTTFADQAVIAIENVRLFEEIQETSRQLEEASRHKSQFLANMSHELRTPLNAILGYTELIVDGVYGETPEKVQDALKRITANGRHLLNLINDVLDLSKIEAGQLTLSLADYSMKDVVHSVYAAVEPLAAEKQIGLKAEIAPDLPAGRGDERRLTQVLLNLVSNAIKFTDEGEVKIRAAADDGHFSVAVVDTGPGISEDDQKKLFQEFQQADSSTTKKKGGTGLGLAISKRIVEMHGGSVGLDSKLGAGSTFSFTVPLRAEQPKKPA
ncbi:MAG: GAF domain-containing protein, partial [Pseudolabrys sp.]